MLKRFGVLLNHYSYLLFCKDDSDEVNRDAVRVAERRKKLAQNKKKSAKTLSEDLFDEEDPLTCTSSISNIQVPHQQSDMKILISMMQQLIEMNQKRSDDNTQGHSHSIVHNYNYYYGERKQ